MTSNDNGEKPSDSEEADLPSLEDDELVEADLPGRQPDDPTESAEAEFSYRFSGYSSRDFGREILDVGATIDGLSRDEMGPVPGPDLRKEILDVEAAVDELLWRIRHKVSDDLLLRRDPQESDEEHLERIKQANIDEERLKRLRRDRQKLSDEERLERLRSDWQELSEEYASLAEPDESVIPEMAPFPGMSGFVPDPDDPFDEIRKARKAKESPEKSALPAVHDSPDLFLEDDENFKKTDMSRVAVPGDVPAHSVRPTFPFRWILVGGVGVFGLVLGGFFVFGGSESTDPDPAPPPPAQDEPAPAGALQGGVVVEDDATATPFPSLWVFTATKTGDRVRIPDFIDTGAVGIQLDLYVIVTETCSGDVCTYTSVIEPLDRFATLIRPIPEATWVVEGTVWTLDTMWQTNPDCLEENHYTYQFTVTKTELIDGRTVPAGFTGTWVQAGRSESCEYEHVAEWSVVGITGMVGDETAAEAAPPTATSNRPAPEPIVVWFSGPGEADYTFSFEGLGDAASFEVTWSDPPCGDWFEAASYRGDNAVTLVWSYLPDWYPDCASVDPTEAVIEARITDGVAFTTCRYFGNETGDGPPCDPWAEG